MTCIVGLVAKGVTWLGADSSLTLEGTGERVFMGRPKIWRSNGWILGTAGAMGFLDSAEECESIPDREGCTVEELRDWLGSEAADRKAKDWAVIVGGGGSLACFFSNGLWTTCRDIDYAAIGSGEPWALGAMHATAGRAPKKRLELALGAAIRHCTSVCGPIQILKG